MAVRVLQIVSGRSENTLTVTDVVFRQEELAKLLFVQTGYLRHLYYVNGI
jgi:hypothetical protein